MNPLWRGSLLPLGREATPKPSIVVFQIHRDDRITTAAQPSGSKLPHHKGRLNSSPSPQICDNPAPAPLDDFCVPDD
ncbi:hypothetical protein EB795_22240 [Pseudomonas mandelii]|nr:hypothetical protein [Pseudomonas mandelii]